MTADAILLIVERVFPETATQGHTAESYLLDLEMFRAILTAAGFGGHCHTRQE